MYVVGDVHTNTIEGFWSLVKRGISGVNHAVGANHLQGYFDSNAFVGTTATMRRPCTSQWRIDAGKFAGKYGAYNPIG